MLVAIAIPVFTSQLEKSREATDLANIRSAYAEVTVAAIDDEENVEAKEVTLKQTVADWQTADAADNLANICGNSSYVTGNPASGGKATITWVPGTATVEGHCTIAFGA